MSAYWAVARLQTNREALALHFLEAEGYQPYYPLTREWARRFGRKIELRRPLFVGYCFICVRLQWSKARWSPGVAHLVLTGGVPARCPEHVIDELRRRERNGAIELPQTRLKPGDKLRVVGGIFAGRLALYHGQAPGERIAVLLELLGSPRRVVLAADAVEPLLPR
jgi:transcription antitermination factor NusG